MTKDQVRKVLDRVLDWPEERQQIAVEMLLELDPDASYEPTPEEQAAIAQGLREAERGEFASEAEVAALWRRYGQ